MKLDEHSEIRLEGVHPDLVMVVRRCAANGKVNFMVTEGLRTIERQRKLIAAGASRTMKSRHLNGCAVDLAVIVDGQVRFDWPLYPILAAAMSAAAKDVGVTIEWGGVWRKFRDGCHFQLPFNKKYPAPK